MRRAPLILLAAPVAGLAACAGTPGDWPSLNLRPEERQALAMADAPQDQPDASQPAPSAAQSAVLDARTRLATVTRDLDTATQRWTEQEAATRAGVAAAKGARPNSDAWSKAQLELSRLEQIGNQLAALRDRINAIAGDLALAANNGGNVDAALAQTGALLSRLVKLQSQHAQAFAAANAALPR